ncbi:MAG: tetratricopeptide repeat protein [Pseudomonadota bacterium]
MSFISEIHRRNVVRVGIAYLVTAWLLLQIADVVMENIGAPAWVMQALLFVLVAGLLPVVLFAWVFELTPEGLKRDSEVAREDSIGHVTRRKIDTLIIILLASALGYLVWDDYLGSGADELAIEGSEAPTAAPLAPADYLPQEKSVAVLPFVNLSSDPEQEFFSDGISEELLNVLAQIPELRVAARTSSFQFKNDNRDIKEIAELLKVNHVLEGSVRKAGTRLRITAQLIEAEHGYHLWSNTYDRELTDVFAIQDEISLAIADALRAELELVGENGSESKVAETSNTAAYEAFLKGRALVNKRGNEAITAGMRELEKSVRLDPNYAPARAQLAIAITLLTSSSSSYGDLRLTEVNERAGEQIRAAEALNPKLPELAAAKALLASVNGDGDATIRFADQALTLRPNYPDANNWKINELNALGRFREALDAKERLLEVDPLSVIGRLNAVGDISLTDYDRAMSIAESIAPQSQWASHGAKAQIHTFNSEPIKEMEQLLLAYAIDSQDLLVNGRITLLFASLDMTDEALRIARELEPYVQVSNGEFEAAEAAFERLLAADPESRGLRVNLGSARYGLKKYAEALSVWREALRETPNGLLLEDNGNYVPFVQMIHAALLTGQDELALVLQKSMRNTMAAAAEIGYDNAWWYAQKSALEAVAGNDNASLEALQSAVEKNFAQTRLLEEAYYAPLSTNEVFLSLKKRVSQKARDYRLEMKALVCDRNPIPDHWRPLATTCDR